MEEINIFTGPNEVLHFKNPKLLVGAQSNMYIVSGRSEKKTIDEMMPGILEHLPTQTKLDAYQKVLEMMKAQGLLDKKEGAAAAGASTDAAPGVSITEDDAPPPLTSDFEAAADS